MIPLTDEGEGIEPQVVGTPSAPPPTGPIDAARRLATEAAALGKMLLLPSDPHTALRGELGTRKAVAWSDPIPLATLKTMARASGAKINDVLSAAVSERCAATSSRAGRPANHLTIRALVPVNLQGYREQGRLRQPLRPRLLRLPAPPFTGAGAGARDEAQHG